MAGSLNKDELIDLYDKQGLSIPKIAAKLSIPRSRARKMLIDSGVTFRSTSDSLKLVSDELSFKAKNRIRPKFTQEQKNNISRGRRAWAAKFAVGVSKKPNGYLEHTMGEHKYRSVHVVNMEKRLGRKLLPDETVHHIDRNRLNNDDNNLALVTRSGHTRLHRFEDALEGKKREREANGRLAKSRPNYRQSLQGS